MVNTKSLYLLNMFKQVNSSDLSQFPLLAAFIEKRASEIGMVKEAAPVWLKVLRGIIGSKAAQRAMRNKMKNYAGAQTVKSLRSMPAKGYPEAGRMSHIVESPAKRLREVRNSLNPKYEFLNRADGVARQRRGGMYDEFMLDNDLSRLQYGVNGRKGIPARFSIDKPERWAHEGAYQHTYSAAYSPRRNAIYDGFGRRQQDILVNNRDAYPYLASLAKKQSPSALRHLTARHELSHWKQVDLPIEQVSRNARYADAALSKALRTEGLRFGGTWSAPMGKRPTAITEAFNNVQAATGNGFGATRFRSITNYNPRFKWNMDFKTLPNTPLYNGRAGVTQAVGNYNMPVVPRRQLP